MNSQRRCSHCGTVNDSFFEYCFKCGAPLNRHQAYTRPFYGDPAAGNYYEPATVAGHPTGDVKAFVGQNDNSRKLFRKLADTELTGVITHWCWPVFLLSLLGPMFAAVWFFYRKMYKIGALVGLMGLLIAGADILLHLSYNVAVVEEMLEIAASSSTITELISNLGQDATTLPAQGSIGILLSSVIDLISLASGVVLSMFAVGIYKAHIKKTLAAEPNKKSDFFALAQLGGTSATAAVISTLSLWIITNVLDTLPLIIALSKLI